MKNLKEGVTSYQMAKLEAAKKETRERLGELERGKRGFRELPADFKGYRSFLELMGKALREPMMPEIKAKIIKRLVHKVEIGVDKVKIHYYAGEDSFREALGSPTAPDFFADSDFFKCGGSSTLFSGAP